MRFLDYLVGVSTGRYPPPNPLVHPRYSGSILAEQKYLFNPNQSNHNEDPFHFSGSITDKKRSHIPDLGKRDPLESRFNPYVPLPNKPVGNEDPFLIFDKYQEPVDKILEIKKCLIKIGSPNDVGKILASCLSNFDLTGKCTLIDKTLRDARRMSRWNDAMRELNST